MADIEEQVQALREGRAMVDLSAWRKVQVNGPEAEAWLQDLLSADVASLRPAQARRSLLLSPTGRVRADLQVARAEDHFLLLQDREQREHIGLLLSPYLLSSEVSLHDAAKELTLIAVVGAAAGQVGLAGFTPSVLGPGIDLAAPAGKASWRVEDALTKAGLVEVGADAVETWRIRRGVARMGPDFDADSLPSEAGLDDAIDRTKGCFLGQESVARIDNLGHPPRILAHVAVNGDVERGDLVLNGEREVGRITSAAPAEGSERASLALARVTWDAASQSLSLVDGRPLMPISVAG